MSKKFNKSILGWTVIYLIIALNVLLLIKIKANSLSDTPLDYLDIKKPTMVVFFDEYECVDCLKQLFFLNELYSELSSRGRIDILGVVVSKTGSDSKDIVSLFEFPVVVTDNFDIFRRLKIDRTPLIVGISRVHQIIYSDIVPFETGVSKEYLKKGIIDRLYYLSH